MHVEPPLLDGQLHQITVHFATERPDGMTLSLDVEGFLSDWYVPEEPEIVRQSKWELLLADDDL